MSQKIRLIVPKKPEEKVFPVIVQLYPEYTGIHIKDGSPESQKRLEIEKELKLFQINHKLREEDGVIIKHLKTSIDNYCINSFLQKIQSPGEYTRFHIVKQVNERLLDLLRLGKAYQLETPVNPHSF